MSAFLFCFTLNYLSCCLMFHFISISWVAFCSLLFSTLGIKRRAVIHLLVLDSYNSLWAEFEPLRGGHIGWKSYRNGCVAVWQSFPISIRNWTVWPVRPSNTRVSSFTCKYINYATMKCDCCLNPLLYWILICREWVAARKSNAGGKRRSILPFFLHHSVKVRSNASLN